MSQRDLPTVFETAEDLETRIEHEQDARLRSRLHLLLLIRSGQVKSRTQAAKHLVVHRNSVRNWLEAYKRGGLEELLRIGTTGPRPEQKTLPPRVFQTLRERVEGEGFAGYTGAQKWLLEEFGLRVPYRTVHGLIRERLGVRLERARPRHQPRP